MELWLKNIGRIDEAHIEIKGITVIAGANNTGKSTVSRALYSVFNGFHNIREQIRRERMYGIKRALNVMLRNVTEYIYDVDTNKMAKKIYSSKSELLEKSNDAIMEYIKQLVGEESEIDESAFDEHVNDVRELTSRIRSYLEVTDEQIFTNLMSRILSVEFSGQINNIYSETVGEITISIRKQTATIGIEDDKVDFISNFKLSIGTEAIYLDNPFVLDEQNMGVLHYYYGGRGAEYEDHKERLKERLFYEKAKNGVLEEIITNSKLESVYQQLAAICNGELVTEKRSIRFKKKDSEKTLDLRNLSAGLKTFVIIKMLLEKGAIEQNGTIILDEPEIHLHPEWQLVFAEIIVLLQKEFGLHILLNTHSPYFLNAIEVYAAKHGIQSVCCYYLMIDDGEKTKVENVTDKIDVIYQKLAHPLQQLENESYD